MMPKSPKRKTAPSRRKPRADEAQALITVAQALNREAGFNEALATSLDVALTLVGSETGWIVLLNEEGGTRLAADTQAFLLWTWQHRQALNLNLDTDLPETLRSVARIAWDILGLFHRSSSLAESLHSWLRPYLQIHRGMPKWLLPLLQLFWNHHQFERGQRKGSSPLELAGVKDAPSLAEVLDQFFRPALAAQPA